MKKFYILFCITLFVVHTATFAQYKTKSNYEKLDKTKIDTRIDNMKYWVKKAEEGVIPFSQSIPVKPAQYKSSKIKSPGVKTEDSPDVPVTNLTDVTQSENSIFVNPNDADHLLNSNNSTSWSGGSVGSLYGANYFPSSDGGLTWGGSPQGPGGVSNSGDPTTAISLDDREYVNYISSPGGMGISYKDPTSSWSTVEVAPNPGSLADKNHMWIDNSPTSSHEGNLYVAWTDFGGSYDSEIAIKRSINDGQSWLGGTYGTPISTAVNAGSHNQGVHIQTGPNGEVYVCWAIYDGWPTDETAIGFAKSTDGGATYSAATRIITNIRGIRTTETNKNHRVNSFPVMAVDISGGPNNGDIYIVWTNYGDPNNNNSGANISVYMIRSTDGGSNWSSPIRVNQGPFLDNYEAYFPWITCDPETGNLGVVYYDDRDIDTDPPLNYPVSETATWVAYSTDAGNTWTDMQVSDVDFTPSAIPGLAGGYMGDYLGITSKGNKFYPCWTDTRGGLYMTYVSPFELGLNAGIAAFDTPICIGSTIFEDASSGDPDSYEWIFEGGTPSTSLVQNPPLITYNSPGTFDVTLIVYKGAESDITVKQIEVKDIIADFSPEIITVVVGNTVDFTDESDCVPTSWFWEFEEGTPATSDDQHPSGIQYDLEGSFNVTLTVTNDAGSDIKSDGVVNVVPPEFNMQNGTVTTCEGNFYDSGGPTGGHSNNENYTMTFYPTTTGSMIRTTFNSFILESGYDYLYIYNGENTSAPLIGSYTGSTSPGMVTASNAAGALTFNFTSDISVTNDGWEASISCYSTTSPPIAEFSASTTTPAINTDVTFTDESQNLPTSWSWSFDPNTVTFVNGTDANSQNPVVHFTDFGLYDVTLIATNAYGNDTEIKLNYINVGACTYCITSYTDQADDWISNVTFNSINNSTGAEEPDGYGDYTNQMTSVQLNSSYPLSVDIVVNGSWVQHTWAWIDWNQNCDFTDPGEAYDLGATPGTQGTFTLNTNITVPGNALPGPTRMRVAERYASDPEPCTQTTYGEAEDYTVNIGGGGTAPVANFSADNTIPVIGQTVSFTDLSANGPTSWSWTFSPTTITYVGGTNSSSQNPQVQFDAAGPYTVTLTATNTYGNDSETKVNYINASPPLPSIPPYVDDFESFVSGNYLAVQSPYWTTWTELPGSTDDGYISTDYSNSGTKSVKVVGLTDLVLPLGNKTSGKYLISFYMYIPSGYYGYYNLLQLFNGTSSEWGIEVFFDGGGSGYGNAGGSNAFSFNFSYNTWIYLENIVDLDNDMAELWINDSQVHQWQWSTGALGDGTLNQLGGLDMYAWNVNGTPLYYFDDLSYFEIIQMDLDVFLEGPYNTESSAMSTSLNQGNYIPLSQPFNVYPWYYSEIVSVGSITDPTIVDWVLVELRDAISANQADGSTIVSRQAAFLKNNGQVVDVTGNSILEFKVPVYNNPYAAIYHLNHLGVLSATSPLVIDGIYTYNFSTGPGQAYGNETAHKDLGNGVWGMTGGDGDRNGGVGLSDKLTLWETQAGTKGYLGSDYNLDTESNNQDKDDIWIPNLGRGSQVPD